MIPKIFGAWQIGPSMWNVAYSFCDALAAMTVMAESEREALQSAAAGLSSLAP
jgi:hypothetical protein